MIDAKNLPPKSRWTSKSPSVMRDNSLQFIYLVFSPYAGLAGTRAQSGDRYGSGTLRPWQVLRGRLPLLSPAFRRSHILR